MKSHPAALTAAAALACVLAWSPMAHADVSIGASPSTLDLMLEPGKTTAQTVLLYNSGKDPVGVRASAWDWWHDEQNSKKFGPPGTYPHSAASWISFVPSYILVQPGKAVNVTVTVATPANAKGGNYAVAWFEAVPNANPKSKELRVGARLGVLIMTESRGTAKSEVAVEELAIRPPTSSQLFQAEVRLKNTGDVHVFPKGTLVLLDNKNKLVGHVGFEKRRMLPGEKSTATIKWGGELKPGAYQAVLTVDYGEQGATVKTAAFEVGKPTAGAATSKPVPTPPAPKGSPK